MVWLVLGPHHGDSHTQRSRCGGRASKERLGCPKSGHGCPGGVELVLVLHQKCPGVVKLVMGLHHMSQWGKQREFRDGGASVWALPCEFRW